tara:strand:+ start:141 stop:344 length:204 start_codon:yes stop_codon:yes gene_type:complete
MDYKVITLGEAEPRFVMFKHLLGAGYTEHESAGEHEVGGGDTRSMERGVLGKYEQDGTIEATIVDVT